MRSFSKTVKRKDLMHITNLQDAYDFWFKNMILSELATPQQDNKKPHLQSIIQLAVRLKGVSEAVVDERYEEALLHQVDLKRDFKDVEAKTVRFNIDPEDYPFINGLLNNKQNNPTKKEVEMAPEYTSLQLKEIDRLYHLEFRMVEFLIDALWKVSTNVKNITAMWAKDLNMNLWDQLTA